MSEPPLFSVVIPTYERKERLRACLEALTAQSVDSRAFEVIVVDDGSRDGTEVLIRDLAPPPFELRYVRQKNRGPAAARNRGIEEARGTLVAFTDDDCVPAPDWLRRLQEALEGPAGDGLAGVGGATFPVRVETPVEKLLALRNQEHYAPLGGTGALLLATCNAAFRRAALRQVRGFDEEFRFPGGEDTELCLRLAERGHRLGTAPGAVVFHHHREDLSGLLNTFFRYGLGNGLRLRRERRWLLVLANLASLAMLPRYVKDLRGFVRSGVGAREAALLAAIEYARRAAYKVGLFLGYFAPSRRRPAHAET